MRSHAQIAEPGLETIEDVMEDARPSCLGEELGAKADERSGRDEVLEARPTGAVVHHLQEASLAHGHELGDDPEVVLRHVDRDLLDRFVQLAVDDPGDHLGLPDRHLETLPPQHLDEHRQLELPAALDLPGVGSLRREDTQGDVSDELGVETVLEQPSGELLPVPSGQRRGVDADGHRQAGFVHGEHRQRPRIFGHPPMSRRS